MARTPPSRSSGRSRPGRWLWLLLSRVGLPLLALYGLLWWRVDATISKELKALEAESAAGERAAHAI